MDRYRGQRWHPSLSCCPLPWRFYHVVVRKSDVCSESWAKHMRRFGARPLSESPLRLFRLGWAKGTQFFPQGCHVSECTSTKRPKITPWPGTLATNLRSHAPIFCLRRKNLGQLPIFPFFFFLFFPSPFIYNTHLHITRNHHNERLVLLRHSRVHCLCEWNP